MQNKWCSPIFHCSFSLSFEFYLIFLFAENAMAARNRMKKCNKIASFKWILFNSIRRKKRFFVCFVFNTIYLNEFRVILYFVANFQPDSGPTSNQPLLTYWKWKKWEKVLLNVVYNDLVDKHWNKLWENFFFFVSALKTQKLIYLDRNRIIS